MQSANNINQLLKEQNLNLFQLFFVINKKNNQSFDTFFPVNHLDIIYYLILYTIKGEDIALRTHKQVLLASDWLKEIHEQLRGNSINLDSLRDNTHKKQLEHELPTSFIKSTTERILSEYVPLRLSCKSLYQYKVTNALPFSEDDIDVYLQARASRGFLYGAIAESSIPDYVTAIQRPLYLLWQINDFVDSCIQYAQEKNSQKPNVITMIERQKEKRSEREFADVYLERLEQKFLQCELPEELSYLFESSHILQSVGKKVLRDMFSP